MLTGRYGTIALCACNRLITESRFRIFLYYRMQPALTDLICAIDHSVANAHSLQVGLCSCGMIFLAGLHSEALRADAAAAERI
jgi:hypothetical protein